MIENIIIAFAYTAILFFAAVAFHELGHLLYFSIANIKTRISIKKAAFRIEIVGPITNTQMKRSILAGLLMGLVPIVAIYLYSPFGLLALGGFVFYAIGTTNDIKKIRRLSKWKEENKN